MTLKRKTILTTMTDLMRVMKLKKFLTERNSAVHALVNFIKFSAKVKNRVVVAPHKTPTCRPNLRWRTSCLQENQRVRKILD